MLSDKITLEFITAPSKFSDCLHIIFTRVLRGAHNFPWVVPLSNPDPPGVKKMLFLNFRLSLGVSLGWITPVVHYY